MTQETYSKNNLKEWINEVARENPDWVKQRRRAYLESILNALEIRESRLKYAFSINTKKWFGELINEYLKAIFRARKKIEREFTSWETPTSDVDDYSIERAKEFPIGELVEINANGFAKCIWHDDNNPSMYCKNNFAHCFSCGQSGSVIDVYMQLYNCGFVEAIKALQ